MDAASISEGLQALPLPALLAAATGVVLLAAVVMRVLSNNFPGKAPPVEEGIPFIGGLIKFSKVGSPPAAAAAAAFGWGWHSGGLASFRTCRHVWHWLTRQLGLRSAERARPRCTQPPLCLAWLAACHAHGPMPTPVCPAHRLPQPFQICLCLLRACTIL